MIRSAEMKFQQVLKFAPLISALRKA